MGRGAFTKSLQGRNADVERKVGECFQWKAPGQFSKKETHVVSVMTDQYKETCTVVRDEKDDRPLPHQIRRPRLTAREKNPQKHQATEIKSTQTKGIEIPCRYKNCKKKKKKPSCKFWHPSVNQNNKSETGCTFGRTWFFRHVEAEEKPSKKSMKGGAKGSDQLRY